MNKDESPPSPQISDKGLFSEEVIGREARQKHKTDSSACLDKCSELFSCLSSAIMCVITSKITNDCQTKDLFIE